MSTGLNFGKPNPAAAQSNESKTTETKKPEQSADGTRAPNTDAPDTLLNQPATVNEPAKGEDGKPMRISSAPTAEEVGMDVDAQNDLVDELAALHAANRGLTADQDGVTIYTSHPVSNYHLGRFRFEDGTLRLNNKDADEFEAMLDQLPAPDRAMIAKLDLGRVDDIVQQRNAVSGIADSSAGRAALERLKETTPRLGTVALEDMQEPRAGFTSATGNDVRVVETAPEKTNDSQQS